MAAEFFTTGDQINPFLQNGFSYYYHFGESTFILRGIRHDLKFSYQFLIKVLLANRMRRPILGFTGRLCSMKRMPGLNEMRGYFRMMKIVEWL